MIACARDADRLRAADADLPGVRAVPGDVTDPAVPRRAGRRRGRPARPARAQRGRARPVAAAAAAGLPAPTRCAPSSRPPCSPRSRSPSSRCRCCAPRRGTVVTLSSDAAVEAYPGWGGYGAAKAALDHSPPCSASRSPQLGSTRSIPATCARPCTSARSRARTSPTGREPETVVPAVLRLLDERPPSGRLPGRRPAGRTGRVRAATAFTVAARAVGRRSRPRPAGWLATGCGCWSPASDARCGTSGSAGPPAARCAGATWSSSTPPTPSPPRSTGTGADGRAGGAARLRAVPADGGESIVELRTPDGAPGRATARRASRPAARRRDGDPAGRAPRPAPPHAGSRLWRARIPAAGGRLRAGCARSAARSPTPTCADAGRSTTTAPCSPAATATFGSAEMPSAARPFTPAVLCGLRRRGVRRRRAGAAHRRLLAGGRRGAAARALPRAGDDGRRGERDPRRGRAGRSRSAPR